MATARETLPAPVELSRTAPGDPGQAGTRSTATLPDAFAPGAVPRKPESRTTGTARESLRENEAGPAPAGPKHAAHPDGKGVSAAALPSPHATTGHRADSIERRDILPDEPGDHETSGSFAGLSAVAPGIEQGTRAADVPSASGSGAAAPGTPLPVPLFEQVAMKMTPLADGTHDVEIRLTPEHLGKLKIELHMDSGRVDALLHADNPEARAMLLREEPALREALRNAGVTLSSFNVALSGEPWKEGKGGTQPNGDADSAPRRGRKDEPIEGVAAVHGDEAGRGGTSRTDHWIA